MFVMTDPMRATLPPRCDQLQVATGITDLMEVVGFIIFVDYDITLNRRGSLHTGRYHALVRVHGCHTPIGQGPIRSHQPHGFYSL